MYRVAVFVFGRNFDTFGYRAICFWCVRLTFSFIVHVHNRDCIGRHNNFSFGTSTQYAFVKPLSQIKRKLFVQRRQQRRQVCNLHGVSMCESRMACIVVASLAPAHSRHWLVRHFGWVGAMRIKHALHGPILCPTHRILRLATARPTTIFL